MAAPSSDHDIPPRVFLLDGAALLESRRRLRAGRNYTRLWVKMAGDCRKKIGFHMLDVWCRICMLLWRLQISTRLRGSFQQESDFAICMPSCGANIPMP